MGCKEKWLSAVKNYPINWSEPITISKLIQLGLARLIELLWADQAYSSTLYHSYGNTLTLLKGFVQRWRNNKTNSFKLIFNGKIQRIKEKFNNEKKTRKKCACTQYTITTICCNIPYTSHVLWNSSDVFEPCCRKTVYKYWLLSV